MEVQAVIKALPNKSRPASVMHTSNQASERHDQVVTAKKKEADFQEKFNMYMDGRAVRT